MTLITKRNSGSTHYNGIVHSSSSQALFDENNTITITSSLSRCAQDIDSTLRSLKQRFNELQSRQGDVGSGSSPADGPTSTIHDPTRLISRLTALENSISVLKNECQFIAKKRSQVVRSIMVKQNQNIERLQKLMTQQQTNDTKNAIAHALDEDDSNQHKDVWEHVVGEMTVQVRVLNRKGTSTGIASTGEFHQE